MADDREGVSPAIWAVVLIACLVGIGTILILPATSKIVGLVYGGF